MASIQVNTLSGMMIYTGEGSNTNAATLASRKYGYKDDNLGTLTKLNSGDSSWSLYSSYIYVENETKISTIADIIANTYAYTSTTTLPNIKGDIYLYDGLYSELYSYEYVLNSDLENAKKYPVDDMKLFLQDLNQSIYNKQKYYGKQIEVESIKFAGLQYEWQPKDKVIEDTYSGGTYNVSKDYVRYELEEHVSYKLTYVGTPNTVTYTYSYTTEVLLPNGTNTYTYTGTYTYYTYAWVEELDSYNLPISYAVYGVKYMESLYDSIQNKSNEHIETFKCEYDIYETEPLYAYYISKADTKYKFILNTNSLDTKITNIYVNYDGEFNDWFDNKITFSMDPKKLDDSKDLYSITAADEYYFGSKYYTYIDCSGGNVKLGADGSNLFKYTGNMSSDNEDIAIMSPYAAKAIDFSYMTSALTGVIDLDYHYTMDINCDVKADTTWHDRRGYCLEKLIIGNSKDACHITHINGLSNIDTITELDITGCIDLQKTPNIANLKKLSVFKAANSNIDNFTPASALTMEEVSLPNSVKSIKIEDTSIDKFDYTPSSNLVSISLHNVTGFNTYKTIEAWVKALRKANLIEDGLVNYVSLTNVDWKNADISIILDLQYLGLNKFTGKVEVKGSGINGALNRTEYWALREAYGEESVKSEIPSDLSFEYTLVDGCYDITMTVMSYDTQVIIEDEVEKEIKVETTNDLTINLVDMIVTNTLLDSLFINDTEIINTGEALKVVFESPIIANNTSKLDRIHPGDVLLYKGKELYVFYKEAYKVVENYVKIGTLDEESTNTLIDIQHTITSSICDIKSNASVYVDTIKFDKNEIEINLANNEDLQMFNIGITVLPVDADNRDLVLTVDSDYISSVEVTENVLAISLTGKTGETEIFATAADKTGTTDTCVLKITDEEE